MSSCIVPIIVLSYHRLDYVPTTDDIVPAKSKPSDASWVQRNF